MNMEQKITDRPRYLSELAREYGVSEKTFKSWLQCPQLCDIVKDKNRYYFTILEVKRIIEHLGEP
jgi:hypothetical protein